MHDKKEKKMSAMNTNYVYSTHRYKTHGTASHAFNAKCSSAKSNRYVR